MTANVTPHYAHQRPVGLAERIKRLPGGEVSGLSFVIPVCDICGAMCADQQRHDEWHDRIDPAEDTK